MNIEDFCDYCSSKNGVTKEFPFDDVTLVFKVKGKMFALTSLDDEFRISLKCDPDKAGTLREQYDAVQPGYHMNKKHWNTINVDGSVNTAMLHEWIDESYDLVVSKLPAKVRKELTDSNPG